MQLRLCGISSLFAYNGLSKVVSYEYNAVWSVIAGTARQDFGAVIAQSWLVPLVRLSAYTALVNLNLAVFNLFPCRRWTAITSSTT